MQILGIHPVAQIEIYAFGYLRAAAPFLPQTEQMAKEVEMGWKPPYASQRWMKVETRRIELGCRLQIPIS